MESTDTQRGVRYAGFWVRVLAYFIDYLLLFAANMILFIPLGFLVGLATAGGTQEISDESAALIGLLYYVVVFAIVWLYYALMESSRAQGTLGKRALGLIVTDSRGGRLTFARATGRYFAKLLSGFMFCIGYLMVAFSDRKRGLHDLIAETYVLKKDE